MIDSLSLNISSTPTHRMNKRLMAGVLAMVCGAAWGVPLDVPAGTSVDATSNSYEGGTVAGTYNIGGAGGSASVSFDSRVAVNTPFTLTIDNGGTMVINTNGDLGTYDLFVNNGTLTNNGPVGFFDYGPTNTSATPPKAIFTNNGTLTNHSTGSIVATLDGSNAVEIINTSKIINAGAFVMRNRIERGPWAPITNSGTFTLQKGGVLEMDKSGTDPAVTKGFTNLAPGLLVIQTNDGGAGFIQGLVDNQSGGIVQLDPDGTDVQTISAINSTTAAGRILNIVGDGTVNKTAAGTTIFDGAMVYTGPTNVLAGTLLLSTATASNAVSATTVSSGATLAGIGKAGPTVVDGGGILSPGTSLPFPSNPGTLTVAGNLVLNAGSITEFELGKPTSLGSTPGTDTDLVAVEGSLTMNGVLRIKKLDGFQQGDFKIFTYTGTLDKGPLAKAALTKAASVELPPGVNLDLDIDTPNEVWLRSKKVGPAGGPTATPVPTLGEAALALLALFAAAIAAPALRRRSSSTN